jgi:integrase
MGYLVKRKNRYYVRYKWTEFGERKSITRTLGTRYKKRAQELLDELHRLEEIGKINPYMPSFNPLDVIQGVDDGMEVNTVRDSLNLFLNSKSHLSEKTIDAYSWAIEHFMDANGLANSSPFHINRNHFEKIIFKPDISIQSRHYYFRHFRAWWNWMLEHGIVHDDFFKEISKRLPQKRKSTRKKMITADELQQVFAAFGVELLQKMKLPDFDKRKVQYWFRPMICLYVYAGLRKNEAAYSSKLPYSGLKGENLIYEAGDLTAIYLPPGKGRSEKEVPLHPIAKKELQYYLKIRRHFAGELNRSDYVFVYMGGRWKGRPVSGSVVYKEFKRYAKKAGIPESRTVHGMRHRAVTSWLEMGFNIYESAQLAGHSTQRVTADYVHLASKHLKDKMNRLTAKDESEN